MSLPSVTVGAGLPLFTIEQIELIRRLRNSGVTKEQVIQAFDSFTRIDSELGHLYTVPHSLTPSVSPSLVQTASQSHTQSMIQSLPQSPVQSMQTKKVTPTKCQSAKASSSTEVVKAKRRRVSSADDDAVTAGGEDTIEIRSFEDQDGGQSQNVPSHGIDDDLKARLEDFMKLPAPKRLDEILMMVTIAGVRVPDIAAKTGLTASTISRFLTGDTLEISTNQKRSIYLWYLMQLQKTEGSYILPKSVSVSRQILQGQGQTRGHQFKHIYPGHQVTKTEQNQDISMVDSNFSIVQASDFVPRRERFTFREKHLDILDDAFRQNQYPSNEEREQIAVRCNEAMITLSGRELSEREKVSCYIVSNWFNNRRKEIKRLAREEGISCSEVVIPTRQKPRTQIQSPVSLDSPFSQVSDEMAASENNESSDTNHLDPATINKLLYDITDRSIEVKQEPPDSEVSD